MMTKKKYQREENKHYRKIEAMYRNGYTVSEICNATKESPISVICIMQRVFAMDQM